jgi:hypothetical protein
MRMTDLRKRMLPVRSAFDVRCSLFQATPEKSDFALKSRGPTEPGIRILRPGACPGFASASENFHFRQVLEIDHADQAVFRI